MEVGLVGRSAGVSSGTARNSRVKTAPWRVTTGADVVFLARTVKRCSDIARCTGVSMTPSEFRTLTAVQFDSAQPVSALVDLLSGPPISALSSEVPALPKTTTTRRAIRAGSSEIMTRGTDPTVPTRPTTESFCCRRPWLSSTPVWRASCRDLGDQLGAAG